jgi:hypothetical protein
VASSNLEGTVRVTASETFAEPIFASLPGLKRLHPNIADLAIRFGDTPQQGLIVKKLLAWR